MQAKALSEQFDILAIDLRNHGRSPHAEAIDYKLMSTDLLELLDSLSLDKVLLMGHSMGGKVAMQFALDHPDAWKSLLWSISPP